eukprot:365187-Chlamydomonas_euryale.AAC.27
MSARSLFESGGGQSSVIRWASLAVILGLGLFVLGVVMSDGDSLVGSVGISSSGVRGSCHAQSATYKRVHTDTGIELFALREDTHYAKVRVGAMACGARGHERARTFVTQSRGEARPGCAASECRRSCGQSDGSGALECGRAVDRLSYGSNANAAQYNLGAQLPKFYSGMLCQNKSGSSAGGNSSNVTSCEGVVLDVGAYLGTHALYLASLGYEVHAFEIQDTAAELLRCAASAAKLDNVMVTQEGISDENGYEW